MKKEAADTTTDQASGQVGSVNGPEWTDDGKVGKALAFTASDHNVEFPEDAIMDITEEVTMEAWVYADAVQGDSGVMGRRNAGNVGGYCSQWTAGMFEMWVHFGGWQGTRGKQVLQPELGEWHHVAFVYTGDKMIQYVNGEVDSEFDQSGDFDSIPEVFRIGQAQTGLGSVVGMIDEVAVYNRALTAEEIVADMEQGVIAAVSPQGSLITTWATIRSR